MQGNHKITDILLSIGVHPNVKDQFSQTPLFWAARQGQLATANALLQKSHS
jgi:ankyrin repeat protein